VEHWLKELAASSSDRWEPRQLLTYTTVFSWIFFLNLFLDGVVTVIVLTVMDLKTPPGTVREKIKKMDW